MTSAQRTTSPESMRLSSNVSLKWIGHSLPRARAYALDTLLSKSYSSVLFSGLRAARTLKQ